ncbi:hypothetical protein BOTBODRAFT_30105 [Botryobasidium botryosum FD-172 SS1]|uniref:Uncharacterized protein n=1 Tax=Botryobasidium botryosum (strain FD-172 SS1) TaxID=930990 RepID=A0A067MNG4_BOTB1|nr:hypothetical protein BOTBODRAFT_30105 [Botryobasidium botryosum FD-172 SS1]
MSDCSQSADVADLIRLILLPFQWGRLQPNSEQFNEFISKCVDLVKSESRFRDIDSTFPSWMQVLNLGAAMVIVAGRLFWLRGDLPRGFETTLASYLASNTIDAVREAIRQTLGSDEPLDSVEQAEKLLQIVMANRTTPQQ